MERDLRARKAAMVMRTILTVLDGLFCKTKDWVLERTTPGRVELKSCRKDCKRRRVVWNAFACERWT